MNKLLIKNATLVNEGRIYASDVLIEGERIARIAPDISAPDAVVIDAAGVSQALAVAVEAVRPGGQITKVGWGPQPLGFSLEDKDVRRAGLDYWDQVDLWVHPNWFRFRDAISRDRCLYFSANAERVASLTLARWV